eukprot:scaffold669564_cov74-Prasinocladus_malaysianus.AAC.1
MAWIPRDPMVACRLALDVSLRSQGPMQSRWIRHKTKFWPACVFFHSLSGRWSQPAAHSTIVSSSNFSI